MRSAALLLVVGIAVFAQTTVPYIGCPTDGQTGPGEAPTGSPVRVSIASKLASQLAYYTAGGVGVLAPRGWHCFDLHGSSGHVTFISPDPIDGSRFLGNDHQFTGSVIVIDFTMGEGSGRWAVGEVIARILPAHRKYLDQVQELFPYDFPEGPYRQVGPPWQQCSGIHDTTRC